MGELEVTKVGVSINAVYDRWGRIGTEFRHPEPITLHSGKIITSITIPTLRGIDDAGVFYKHMNAELIVDCDYDDILNALSDVMVTDLTDTTFHVNRVPKFPLDPLLSPEEHAAEAKKHGSPIDARGTRKWM